MISEEALFQTVVRALPASPEEVTPESTLHSLGVTSMDLLNSIFLIESELGVNLLAGQDELEDFRTVGDTVRIVRRILERES
jgi:acyl carrier protein